MMNEQSYTDVGYNYELLTRLKQNDGDAADDDWNQDV
jgi:hypothetical protein